MAENEIEVQNNGNVMVANLENINQGTIAIESNRAIAEAQGMLLLAKQFPRNYINAYNKAMEACRRKSFAEKAFYKYPRGGHTVEGLSIRFAEEMANCYGNINYGIKEMSRDKGKSEMCAFAWDLENNTKSEQNFTVEHIMESSSGNRNLTSSRDIYERTANDGARRLRSRILAVIPADFIEDCKAECHKTLRDGNGEPLIDRVKKMAVEFTKIGVTTEMLEKKMGHKLEAMNTDELVEFIQIYNGIKNKETTIAEWFEQPKIASQMTELLKADAEKDKSKKKGKDES